MKLIYINFKPSNILTTLLISAGLGSVSMVLLVEFSYVIKILLLVLIVICTVYFVIDKALLLMPYSFVTLRVGINDDWQLQSKDGRNVEIFLSKDSVVTAHLTILNFRIAPVSSSERSIKNILQNYLFSHSLVILPDSVDAENYRQLRLRLRWR